MKMQIITRGSLEEGLGHLFRTRTFAKYAAAFHEITVIAIVETELQTLLADIPCPVHLARTDAEALAYIQAHDPDVLVFDTTWLSPFVFAAAAKRSRLTVSLSPVFDQANRVDALFTRSARMASPGPGVHVFGGLEFSIFNEHCSVIDDATYDRALGCPQLPVAISMGGADAANKTLSVLHALSGLAEPTTVWVLLGEGYAHSYNALVDSLRGDQRHEIILAKTSRSMWSVMSHCALAILAGGLTTVEAIHAGLPTLNLFEKPEHHGMLDELFEQGVCLNGGLFSENSLQTMVKTLARLHRQRDELRNIRARTKGRVDFLGPQRVLSAIEQLFVQKGLPVGRRSCVSGGGSRAKRSEHHAATAIAVAATSAIPVLLAPLPQAGLDPASRLVPCDPATHA